jgi:hypothetical protein
VRHKLSAAVRVVRAKNERFRSSARQRRQRERTAAGCAPRRPGPSAALFSRLSAGVWLTRHLAHTASHPRFDRRAHRPQRSFRATAHAQRLAPPDSRDRSAATREAGRNGKRETNGYRLTTDAETRGTRRSGCALVSSALTASPARRRHVGVEARPAEAAAPRTSAGATRTAARHRSALLLARVLLRRFLLHARTRQRGGKG